ncbi:hypothetical protein OSB04_004854 [Centaurea solstitialis]|uniref:BHLH domain-containing protein n=1 Tax=Centaurea solstitialis TaxID=347529 RepID=A0AA38TEX0_9ASTR|nr:hypothetical protein OSB04_004854 [Centaurea solstitialis]
MDDLPIQWYNHHHHHHDHDHDHQQHQILDFDSENMFLNINNSLIHQLPPAIWPDPTMATTHNLVSNNGSFQERKNVISITNPTTTGTNADHAGCKLDRKSTSGSCQFLGDKLVSWTTNPRAAATTTPAATSLESLDCLLSVTNSNTDASDGISVIFSDCKGLWPNNVMVRNNNVSGVSSGDSVTKELDDGGGSQCSSGKRRIIGRSGVSESDNNPPKPKRSRSNTGRPTSSNINFQQPGNPSETDTEAIAQMKEMIYREAAFRPVCLTVETVVEKPKRKNVRISSDPQTVAARQRRERVSERIRVLQKLVPGGNKMDTASMLDEAANYLKFLRSQVKALEQVGQNSTTINANGTNPLGASMVVPFGHNPFSMQTHFHQFPHDNLYPNNPSSS